MAANRVDEAPMIGTVLTQRRHAARYRRIARVLIAHGLEGLVAPLDLGTHVRAVLRRTPGGENPDAWDVEDTTTRGRRAWHVRKAFEELGPTFIKLGQMLSTRADILPPEYIAELSRLQDSVAPTPFPAMRRVLEMELGATVEAVFDHFDDVPLASASIGQVYAARLKDGADVIVKVQRPGVDAMIEEDLAILAEIARVAEGRLAIAQQADASGLVREFSWTLREELDYGREGRNAERLQAAFPDGSEIVIPRVVWEFTTRRVLTMERLRGVRIDRVGEIIALGVDTKAVAETALLAYVRQVLMLGMFHADPHPGNFLVLSDGSIGLLDFGLVGTLDERVREHLLLLALATFERDPGRISEELAMLGAVPASWDRAAVERDIARLLAKYLDVPLGMIQVREVIYDVMSMIRRHGLRLPSELALLAKTVSQAEALGRRLDPDLNLAQVAGPAVEQALGVFYSPAFWRQKLRMKPLEIALLGASLPSHIQRLLTRLDRNELTFHINYDELPETMQQMNSMVNRIALAVVCAAGAIGASIIFLAVQPVLFSFTGWLFIVLFTLLALMTGNVLWRIWRSGR